jgi:hypothetical protein
MMVPEITKVLEIKKMLKTKCGTKDLLKIMSSESIVDPRVPRNRLRNKIRRGRRRRDNTSNRLLVSQDPDGMNITISGRILLRFSQKLGRLPLRFDQRLLFRLNLWLENIPLRLNL